MDERQPADGARVTIYACTGETPTARLAQDIAARLRLLELAGSGEERVIVIDGCASGCGSRQLAGRGVEAVTVSLTALGVELGVDLGERERDELAAAIAASLAAGSRPRAGRPQRRRSDPPAPSSASVTAAHTAEDYLFAISLLTSPVGACGAVASDVPTLASHVARALGVSRATAGERLVRLEEAGEIERGRDKALVLTERGRAAADRILARHRIVERFLTEVLGYTAAEVHTLALEVRGAFPDDAIERLRRLVAPFSTCPHGWPLEPGTGIELAPDLVALSALPAGGRRPIAALAEHDGQLLARLCDLGLSPGVDIEVASEGPSPTVTVAGATLALEPHEAAAVLVLLSPER